MYVSIKKDKKGKSKIYLRNLSGEGSENCVIPGVSAERKTFFLKRREKSADRDYNYFGCNSSWRCEEMVLTKL